MFARFFISRRRSFARSVTATIVFTSRVVESESSRLTLTRQGSRRTDRVSTSESWREPARARAAPVHVEPRARSRHREGSGVSFGIGLAQPKREAGV